VKEAQYQADRRPDDDCDQNREREGLTGRRDVTPKVAAAKEGLDSVQRLGW